MMVVCGKTKEVLEKLQKVFVIPVVKLKSSKWLASYHGPSRTAMSLDSWILYSLLTTFCLRYFSYMTLCTGLLTLFCRLLKQNELAN